MKKFVNTAVFSAVILCAHLTTAQEYKFKKDVIFLDKEEVALVEGEAGADYTSFKVLSSNKDEIFEVTQDGFKSGNPFSTGTYWYELRYSGSDEVIRLGYVYNCNVKCVFKRKIFPTEVPFDKPAKDQIEVLKDYDISAKINADTLKQLAEYKAIQEKLTYPEVKRDRSKPVDLMFYKKEEESSTDKITYTILQDSQVIGHLVKYDYSVSAVYEFYKKVLLPDSTEELVPLAKSNMHSTNLELTTVADGKLHKLDLSRKSSPHVWVARYLFKTNYL
ncbi:hypothetical protein [Fulvivirga lutea]|uniref:Uncharacterized protein n=1 Tax=Fulvivirga lutea TaxID=2810512 RepID=A0A975A2D5_9BACT|nr:hypothetical protein [Fulvivirga lutea]QSE98726.1 hypothetical protein JR347_06495 [Fulvivirga lutea]